MKKTLILLFLILHSTLFAFEQNILPVEKAFIPTVSSDGKVIHTEIKLADEIYAYDDQLKYKIISPKKVDLRPLLEVPKPVEFHEFIVHRRDIKVDIPLSLIQKEIGEKPFSLQLFYQGCSEQGLCYQPMEPIYAFDASGKLITKNNNKEEKSEQTQQTQNSIWGTKKRTSESENQVATTEKPTTKEAQKATPISEESAIAQQLQDSSFFAILALFFGFGLALSLTPCIFPMIPILSSIITLESKQSGHMSAKRGLFLSFIYITSSALIYAIAGVLSAVFGANILSAMQNPWVIVIFAAIFIALAFSMFGYYEIQLPKALQNFANKKSDESKGGGIVGIAIMGALSALIVGPCVAPPLAAALMFIGQTGDILLGGLALFLLGLGMGAPLLLIGAGGGKFMPKPGGWMTRVSYVFGVVMLAIAVSFLSRILPDTITLLLWALLFIGSGIYAGAMEPFKEGVSGISKLIKVFAVVLLGYGLILLVGAFSGGTSVLDPLKKLYTSQHIAGAISTHPTFTKVKTKEALDSAVAASDKPVLIDFSAAWCVACKELDEITFADPKVQALMQKFTLLQVDVTENSQEDKALQKYFGVVGPPAIIFYDKNHNELKNHKMIGYKPPEEFIPILKNVLGE
jgi:thiol:disulfide interchange protein DsbD